MKRRWDRLWALPQSIVWREQNSVDAVARYTCLVIDAEAKDSPVTLHAHIGKLEDTLGLSPMGMKRLQWEIRDVAAEAAPLGVEVVNGAPSYGNVVDLYGPPSG